MPSKRKKNKRRMRRVQAQRRALEEQHATHPPVKASPGIAVMEVPKVEPKPVVKEPVAEPVPVEALELEPVVLEQTPSEAEVEVPPLVAEETPVIEMPPVEASVSEAAVVDEVETIIPVTEIEPPAEAPVVAPAETEVQTVDSAITTTETEQIHQVCKAETETEAEDLAEKDRVPELEVEVSVTDDTSTSEPTAGATEEPVVEARNTDHVSAEVEAAADTVVTEKVVEAVAAEIPEHDSGKEAVVCTAASADDRKDETGAEVMADASEAQAEPLTTAEDVPAQSLEIPVVPDAVPETPVEKADTPLTAVREAPAIQDVACAPAEDSVHTESVLPLKETVATSDTQTESVDGSRAEPEPEPVVATAEKMPIDTEQTCRDVLSEGPKPEICDTPCQTQLIVESAQLSSAETALETALNGHIVPEVSIEG
ncbi:hypothetical protein Q5P01_015127 [Channa striata]|uniref:Uncharacterized protein n=1 Tax=Channa striata TaxID=64152 RepID=A0AA88MII4_CHASR|nr:hypothetical protein Q5P01_015127 [Channa striata]